MQKLDSFWVKCGVERLDHVAVTTDNLVGVLRDYMGMPGSELIRGPDVNLSQNVDYAFVRLSTGTVVEILGMKENSPIASHVDNGGGVYHFCFTVNNLENAVETALNDGAIQVVEAREDDAFDGRRVAFFMHKNHGLFEFLEAYPKDYFLSDGNKKNIFNQSSISLDNKESFDYVNEAFKKMFPALNEFEIENAEYNLTADWSSLKHLQLFMDIEEAAGVTFSSDDISQIKSFKGFVIALNKKL